MGKEEAGTLCPSFDPPYFACRYLYLQASSTDVNGTGGLGGVLWPTLAALDGHGRDGSVLLRQAAAADPRPAGLDASLVGGTGGRLLHPALTALDGRGRDRPSPASRRPRRACAGPAAGCCGLPSPLWMGVGGTGGGLLRPALAAVSNPGRAPLWYRD